MVVMLFNFGSCKEGKEGLVPFEYDPELVPSMITEKVTTHISDSGVTRYKLIAEIWMVFDQAETPCWYFPEGLYLERFTPDFDLEAIVEADTAWYYTKKDLWRLKKNVHVENMEGEQFSSDELYWDQQNAKVYSDSYIEIKRGDTRLRGWGFESNQEMTNYRIFRPHDGKLPFVDSPPPDSGDSDNSLLYNGSVDSSLSSDPDPDPAGLSNSDTVDPQIEDGPLTDTKPAADRPSQKGLKSYDISKNL